MIRTLVLQMALLPLATSFASAAIPIEIFPLADTYVMTDLNDSTDTLGLKNKNFGNSHIMVVQSGWKESDSQKIWSQAYLTFDLQRIPKDHWNVTLEIKANDIILPDGPKKLVLVYIPVTEWMETDMTFDNRPSQDYDNIVIAETVVSEGVYDYEFDVTDFVDTYEDQELSVALKFEKLDDVGYISFYSKEVEDYKLRPHIFTADVSVGPIEIIPGGGCLIATATYGSELAPQVQQLRELRDSTILNTTSGTSFMTGFNAIYYSFAPTIADWERQNPMFKEAVKLTITPMITSLSILNYVDVDSEAEMIGYGIGIILLNIGMYFVFPAIIILKVRRCYNL